MSPVELLRAYVLYSIFENFVVTKKFDQDVVNTAQVAFQNASDPAVVCSADTVRCNEIIKSLQVAGLVLTNWSLKEFRRNLGLMKPSFILKYDVVVLIIQQNLEFLARVAFNLTIVHSQARYVIVEIGDESESKSRMDCCREEGLKLFKDLWSLKRIYRWVVLRLSCPGYALTADVFSSNKTKCMHRISTTDAPRLKAVFTKEIKNMNGHVIRVTMTPAQDVRKITSTDDVPYEGVDATILREFIRYINSSVDVKPSSDGKIYAYTFPNGTVVGAAADITKGTSDIIFNGNFMYYLDHTPAQVSQWYKEDALCVVIKKPGRGPRILALIKPLSQSFLWAVLAMVGIVGFLVYVIRLATNTQNRTDSNWFDGLATAACFMIEAPATQLKRSHSERILLASCSIWALVVLGTYQGALKGTLVAPKDIREINTLDELENEGYSVYVGSVGLLTVFSSPGNPAMDRLVKRTILVNDTQYIINGDFPKAGTMTRQETGYLRVLPTERLVPDCKRRSQLSFTVRIGSPIIPALNEMLKRFCEAGIIEFLLMSEKTRFEMREKRHQTERSSDNEYLTLADIQGAFVLLAIGSVINTIVFGIELLDRLLRPSNDLNTLFDYLD